jgi:Lon protease-like protein
VADKIPIFTLNTVLFPEEQLPLRIFETRYLDMVRECLRNDVGFGICLIKKGKEVGTHAEPYGIGTYARIVDWDQNPDGILSINVLGGQRFKIVESKPERNQLLLADVDWIDESDSSDLPEKYYSLKDLLSQLIEQLNLDIPVDSGEMHDAMWVSYRIAELFPFDTYHKQEILEIDDDVERLEKLSSLINEAMESDQIH